MRENTIRPTIRRTLWSAYSDFTMSEICEVADVAIMAAEERAQAIRKAKLKPKADVDIIREALWWLDANVPGKAREVLMETLKQ